MTLSRNMFAACMLVAWAAGACAEVGDPPCKNHYILDSPCLPPTTLPGDRPATTVRIAKLYSTLDGTVQAVELDVVKAGGATLLLGGRAMTVRDRHGNTRTFLLDQPPPGSSSSGTLLVLGSVWLDGVDTGWGPAADLAMPDYFLPIDGGVLSIEGMDEIAFGPLPVDGRRALDRDGTVAPADFGPWGSFDVPTAIVSEFYHPGLDHYFMTHRADEIALLKSGAIPGWESTGKAFYVLSHSLGDAYRPVCRYLLQRPGSYSHFFSAVEEECTALADQPGNILESPAAFYVALPSDGVCSTKGPIPGGGYGVIGGPLYRLWNGKPDTNHRFVADKAERDAMIARGWISEGQGIDGIGMCGWTVDLPAAP